jgi:hypothetical protein
MQSLRFDFLLLLVSKIFKVAVVLVRHLDGVRGASGVILRVYVEALVVAGVADGWDDGPAVPAAEHVVPVDAAEEGMRLDAAGSAADVAEAPGAVDCAKGPDDVLGLVGDDWLLGEDDGLLDDSGV